VRDCATSAPHLLSLARNITGVGVGLRFFCGRWIPKDWVVRVYVERKYPLAFLGPLGLPDVFDGVLLDVVETGRLRALAGQAAAGAAVKVGVGVTISLQGSAADGTLGAFVKDQHGKSYLLTCSHVLRSKRHSAGPGVLQMNGRMDISMGRIATVSKKKMFDYATPPSAPNAGDWAIAALDSGVTPDPSLPGPLPPLSPSGALQENDFVVKARSTLTSGTVLDLYATVEINYDFGVYYFHDQILINSTDPDQEFAEPGDSGSLVVKDTGTSSQAVGLVVAAGLSKTDPKTKLPIHACVVCPMAAALDIPGLTLSLL